VELCCHLALIPTGGRAVIDACRIKTTGNIESGGLPDCGRFRNRFEGNEIFWCLIISNVILFFIRDIHFTWTDVASAQKGAFWLVIQQQIYHASATESAGVQRAYMIRYVYECKMRDAMITWEFGVLVGMFGFASGVKQISTAGQFYKRPLTTIEYMRRMQRWWVKKNEWYLSMSLS
jgi:hypothetical protein